MATDALLLWLTGLAILLAVAVLAFAYVLVQRNRDWLVERLQRLGAMLEARWPWAGRVLRTRLDQDRWQGLALTGAAAVFVLMVAAFVGITEGWIERDELYVVDRAVQQALAGALSPALVSAMAALTHLGDVLAAVLVGGVLVVVFLMRRAWERLVALGLVLGVGQGVLWGLKALFSRPRPSDGLVAAAGASFPSGHTFTAVVLYGFLLVLVWRWTDRPGLRGGATVLLGTAMLAVGLSRIVLGVHWVSDVLGGITIGLAWLACSLVTARALGAQLGWDA